MVSERPCVRVPVGPRYFPTPVTFSGLCGSVLDPCVRESNCFVGCDMVPSRFGDESDLAGGKCNRSTCGLVTQR